jgi:hypothetical protein
MHKLGMFKRQDPLSIEGFKDLALTGSRC